MNRPPTTIDVQGLIEQRGESLDYSRLPVHVRPALRRYIELGLEPGFTLKRVLEGRLDVVLIFKDDLPALLAVVQWLHEDVPAAAWGSPDQVQHWIATRRRATGETA